jgi:hypothetical protein
MRPAVFDRDVLTLDEAGFLETLKECGQEVRNVLGRPYRGMRSPNVTATQRSPLLQRRSGGGCAPLGNTRGR